MKVNVKINMWAIIIVVQTLALYCEAQIIYNVDIDTSKVISVTEDEYLSFTLDFSLKVNPDRPWYNLNFSNPRLHTLVRGLAPAHVRFGGSDGDNSVFYNVTSKREQERIKRINAVAVDKRKFGFIVAIFPGDIDKLCSLAKIAEGKLIYGMNIQLRYGPQWDSTNARHLLEYMVEKGYADIIDVELGNEPPYTDLFTTASFNATGERIAKDYIIFKQILAQYPELQNTKMYGPDIAIPLDGTFKGQLPDITRDFAAHVRQNISALTVHHYYFSGRGAPLANFYNLTYLKLLESTLPQLVSGVHKAAKAPLDIWLGEAADSFYGGTPNITNRYVSGFMWLDKLGIAARNGLKMVIRQTFYGYNDTAYYPLISTSYYPNPDYWLSYIFKKLVGRSVLLTKVIQSDSEGDTYFRAYTHCTSPRSGYKTGSLVTFGLNLNPQKSAEIKLDRSVLSKAKFLDLYLLTPENNNLQASNLLLNGNILRMTSDSALPEIKPKRLEPGSKIVFPALTFGFIVIGQNENDFTTLCRI